MRNRWDYVWPQTRKLLHPHDQNLPTNTAKSIRINKNHVALRGSIFDANTFHDRVSTAEQKQQTIYSRSRSMEIPASPSVSLHESSSGSIIISPPSGYHIFHK